MAMSKQEVFTDFEPAGSHTAVADLSSAVTLAEPAGGASKLLIQAISANVRLTLDGTTPTASLGFQLQAGYEWLLPVGDGTVVKAIQESAGAGIQYQFGN